MASQYLYCPSGCYHKFVIPFATQYMFAREAPRASTDTRSHSKDHTLLSLGNISCHTRISLVGNTCLHPHLLAVLHHKIYCQSHTPLNPSSSFVWHIPLCICVCTRFQHIWASRRSPLQLRYFHVSLVFMLHTELREYLA
jgi:hypothetical protein